MSKINIIDKYKPESITVFDYLGKTYTLQKKIEKNNNFPKVVTTISNHLHKLIYMDEIVNINGDLQIVNQGLDLYEINEIFFEELKKKNFIDKTLDYNKYFLLNYKKVYSRKYENNENADLHVFFTEDSNQKSSISMLKRNGIVYDIHMFFYVENYFPEKTYKKSIFIQTYNENSDNFEFVLQLDFKIDGNLKNAYDIDFYYDERLFTEDVEKIIFDYYQVDFDNKNIDMNKHQLSINSFKHDYKNLDIIFDDKTYLLRKIENFNGEKIKIFNQNYNLIYEKEYQPLKTIKKHENSEYITDKFKRMTKSNFMLRSKKIYYIFGD